MVSEDRPRPVRVLAIAGSLRRRSHNGAMLRAASRVAPDRVEFEIFTGLPSIPVFNEDLEADLPAGVVDLRRSLDQADGLLIATPEYNQSVPGVVKNTIDWLSRADGLTGRAVAVIGASTGPWGTRISQTLLRQMLLSVGAIVMPAPTLFVANVEELLGVDGELADVDTIRRLDRVVASFADWIRLVTPEVVSTT